MKNIKIFLLFARYSLKTTFQSKTGVILFTTGKLIRFVMFFSFVYYLMANTKILAGYTLTQTIIFYLTYTIIDSLSQLLFREVYRFRPLVVSGELDSILVKPYHPFLRILTGGIDILDLGITIMYAAIASYFIVQIPTATITTVIIYVLLIINSLFITLSFHIAVLALGILSTEVDHTIMIYRDMTKMGTFPVDIYTQPIRFLFTYIVPIGIMLTLPVKSLFGLLSWQSYLVSVSFALGSILISMMFWNYALKKYQSWGG